MIAGTDNPVAIRALIARTRRLARELRVTPVELEAAQQQIDGLPAWPPSPFLRDEDYED